MKNLLLRYEIIIGKTGYGTELDLRRIVNENESTTLVKEEPNRFHVTPQRLNHLRRVSHSQENFDKLKIYKVWDVVYSIYHLANTSFTTPEGFLRYSDCNG
ncbi:hypothetical protein DICVIV_06355 [Dictyocaulus viviparus]|uniref:Uncharacterized protein n=1 Tax=Dictyocaulus viviparus TaxID=29172 RepID=A0A0D8XUX0_DICVI|nr:hypothetical protein DICVIV_06355 [Dictyocaulus viviparus]